MRSAEYVSIPLDLAPPVAVPLEYLKIRVPSVVPPDVLLCIVIPAVFAEFSFALNVACNVVPVLSVPRKTSMVVIAVPSTENWK